MNKQLFNFLLFGSIVIVFLTNDSSSRTLTIPIGSFNLIERDLLFFPLLFYSMLNWQYIKKYVKKNIFSRYIYIITSVYFLWIIIGIYNGNGIKHIGYAIRQVIYLWIYFPLLAYFNSSIYGYNKVKNILTKLFFVSFFLTIFLSIIFFGHAGMNYRGIFCWIDDPVNFGTFLRVLVAGALYFPFFFLLGLSKYWDKNNKIILSMSIIGLMLTFTRSYWLGTILGLFFFFTATFFSKSSQIKIKKVIIPFLSTIILVSTIFYVFPKFGATVIDRFLSSEDFQSGAIAYRIIEAGSFIEKIQNSIYIGYGTGATVLTQDAFDLNLWMSTPFSHNSYLIYLLYFGSVGTLIILSSYFAIIKKLIKNISYKNYGNKQKYLLAMGAGIIALLGLSFTASEITFAGGYFQLGIILAISDYLIPTKELNEIK